MTAKQVRASRIRGWIEKYGTIGAIKKVREVSADSLKACHQRVISLQRLWRNKGCEVLRVNAKVWT